MKRILVVVMVLVVPVAAMANTCPAVPTGCTGSTCTGGISVGATCAAGTRRATIRAVCQAGEVAFSMPPGCGCDCTFAQGAGTVRF